MFDEIISEKNTDFAIEMHIHYLTGNVVVQFNISNIYGCIRNKYFKLKKTPHQYTLFFLS